MNRTRINIVLSVLLLLTSLLTVVVKVDYTHPNNEFLPTMVYSPASSAFAANSVFPNGRTLQAPVPGTIPRGELPIYYLATKEDAERAGKELKHPFPFIETADFDAESSDKKQAEPAKKEGESQSAEAQKAEAEKLKAILDAQLQVNASISRGAEIYDVFCISCHGASGLGDGPVTKRGFPPPPPLTTGKSSEMKDGQLFHILTYGQGSMSPMVAQLNRARRWDVINYVRSLQRSAKRNLEQAELELPPETKAAPPKKSGEAPKAEEKKL